MPSREVKDLVRRLEKQGWTVVLNRNGHYKAVPPGGGQPEFIAGTPSDWRALLNTVARLKQKGYRP